MAKIASFFSLGMITLDRTDSIPIHRQLYETLRKEILTGRLHPGARLPPTRAMAQELDVARNTIILAYDQLQAEGYLKSKVGGGTYVTDTLPEWILQIDTEDMAEQPVSSQVTQPPEPHLSERGLAVMQIPYDWERKQPRAFCSTLPAVDLFPFKLWEKLLVSSWRSLSSHQLGYHSAMGYRPLREALADYLQTARGVQCTADQIAITNGAQQGLTTAVKLLLNPSDKAWVENPCYSGYKAAISGTLAEIVPVPVDEEGLVVQDGIDLAPDARMSFISPSHQYPLGVTMSLTRRLQLLEWAQRSNAWIIEDDYDSEYRYEGYPLSALQRLDNTGRVIYIGTFSKVLFPALRVGYMVVPPNLVEPIHAARAHADRGTALLEQVALTQFINEGHLARHVRRMRVVYAERQAAFVQSAQTYLDGLLDVQPSPAGLHLVGWLPDGVDDQAVSQQLLAQEIDAPPLSSFAITPLSRGGLVIGFSAIPADEICAAVKRMRPVLATFAMTSGQTFQPID